MLVFKTVSLNNRSGYVYVTEKGKTRMITITRILTVEIRVAPPSELSWKCDDCSGQRDDAGNCRPNWRL